MDRRDENPRSGRGQGDAVCSDGTNAITTAGLQESFERSIPATGLLSRLRAEFRVIREFRPLGLRLDLATCNAARDTTDKQQRRALATHCASPAYLENVAHGGERFALDGTVRRSL